MGIVFHQCYSFIWFNNLLLSCSKNCLLIYFLSKGNKTCLWLYKKKPVELLFQRIDWQDTQQTKHQSILCFSPPSISATGVGTVETRKEKTGPMNIYQCLFHKTHDWVYYLLSGSGSQPGDFWICWWLTQMEGWVPHLLHTESESLKLESGIFNKSPRRKAF